jgi:hypothetical protein
LDGGGDGADLEGEGEGDFEDDVDFEARGEEAGRAADGLATLRRFTRILFDGEEP